MIMKDDFIAGITIIFIFIMALIGMLVTWDWMSKHVPIQVIVKTK